MNFFETVFSDINIGKIFLYGEEKSSLLKIFSKEEYKIFRFHLINPVTTDNSGNQSKVRTIIIWPGFKGFSLKSKFNEDNFRNLQRQKPFTPSDNKVRPTGDRAKNTVQCFK